MKKRQKGFIGVMLACLLVCLPVSQALAEVQIEAAEVDGKLLFPEDSLVNAWLPVMMDCSMYM